MEEDRGRWSGPGLMEDSRVSGAGDRKGAVKHMKKER